MAVNPLLVVFTPTSPFDERETPRVNVPEEVIGFPEIVSPAGTAKSTEVTPFLRHCPLMSLTHPPERMIPFEKVEDAEVDVRLRAVDCIPPANVEVEFDVTSIAPDDLIPPPVTVIPFEEESPAASNPPENVEVEVVLLTWR